MFVIAMGWHCSYCLHVQEILIVCGGASDIDLPVSMSPCTSSHSHIITIHREELLHSKEQLFLLDLSHLGPEKRCLREWLDFFYTRSRMPAGASWILLVVRWNNVKMTWQKGNVRVEYVDLLWCCLVLFQKNSHYCDRFFFYCFYLLPPFSAAPGKASRL